MCYFWTSKSRGLAKKFGIGRVWRTWTPLLLFFLVATAALECNKTGGLNSNVAYVSVFHTAQGRGPLEVFQQNGTDYVPIQDSAISYGTASGGRAINTTEYIYNSGYDTVQVGVNGMQVREGATGRVVSTGNTTFNNGRFYSVFLYDDSVAKSPLPIIILPDNIVTSIDTFSFLRWMNFCPNTYYNIRITSVRPDADITGEIRDSIASGFLQYVGNNEKISTYAFRRVHSGRYKVTAYKGITRSFDRLHDSLINPVTITDSLFLIRDSSYTAILQGFENGTGSSHIRMRVIQHQRPDR